MVQRLKVTFIREIWLPIQETRRFVLYPGDSRIIWESWHVWESTLLEGDTKAALLIVGGMDTQGEIFNDSFLLLASFRQ